MKIHSFIIIASAALHSCSSGTDKTVSNKTETKDTVPAKENFVKGQVIDKVVNLLDPSQTYAMYLPSGYSADKTYPVIYAFDAHATGKLPVSKYKDLAEKYGYILIGSNNSQNGTSWEQTVSIANSLFSDSQQRLSINTSRIYLMGFSGGARVANGLCITNGGIAGVICCGAAAPAANSKDPRSNYTFLGICGNKDFNYIEMRKYDMVELAGRGVKHAFIEFDGKHEWPPEETIKDGFLWTYLCAIRAKTGSEHDMDSIITTVQEKMFAKAYELRKNGKAMEAYTLIKKDINFFDGTAPTESALEMYNSLKQDPAIDKALKREEAIWKKEEELKAFYQQAFQSKNVDWWKQDIAGLNKKIKTEKKADEVLMYQRVLDYLSLVAYMQTTGAMKQDNVPATKMLAQIYVIIDPANNEAHYLTAEVYAVEGNQKEAISSLNEAVKNGFKDPARLQQDQNFKAFSSSGEFIAVLKKVQEAAAGN